MKFFECCRSYVLIHWSHVESCCLKNGLLNCLWLVGLMLHCWFGTMLKMVVDNTVANVMLDFVDIKVAHMIESIKVAKFIDDKLRSGRLNLLMLHLFWKLNFDVSSYNKRLTNLLSSSELVDFVFANRWGDLSIKICWSNFSLWNWGLRLFWEFVDVEIFNWCFVFERPLGIYSWVKYLMIFICFIRAAPVQMNLMFYPCGPGSDEVDVLSVRPGSDEVDVLYFILCRK